MASERKARMAVSERIWITGGEFGGDKIVYDEGTADAWRDHGHTVAGPYVLEPSPTRGAVDPTSAERLSRAGGLLDALANCSDDSRIEGVREIATEVAALIRDPGIDLWGDVTERALAREVPGAERG